MKHIRFSRTVWLLGVISLLADISSELLYPVLPVYLRNAGYSMLALGILEGVANVIAGISKGYFGHLSDDTGKRHLFVRWGYGLSALGKLLMLGLPDLFRVYLGRATDRLGKGIRTSPRDALLANESTAESRAAVFGFHRSMDTLGAAIGPALALLWLSFHPGDYTTIFILAFAPALLSFFVTFMVRDLDSSDRHVVSTSRTGFFGYLSYWNTSSRQYRGLIRPLLLLALVNSPDTFLLLAIKEAGASDVQMIAVYIFYNLMYALLATPVGVLADRWGREKVLLWAVLFFAITYAGITILTDASYFYVLFGVYALAMSGMESVVKAIIANKVPREDRGKALGFYASANSIGMLIAGVWAGWLWKFSGPDFVFGATAMGAVIVAVWLWFTNREKVYLDK
jgi:MFS family permease